VYNQKKQNDFNVSLCSSQSYVLKQAATKFNLIREIFLLIFLLCLHLLGWQLVVLILCRQTLALVIQVIPKPTCGAISKLPRVLKLSTTVYFYYCFYTYISENKNLICTVSFS
jgi:hypothetical protein